MDLSAQSQSSSASSERLLFLIEAVVLLGIGLLIGYFVGSGKPDLQIAKSSPKTPTPLIQSQKSPSKQQEFKTSLLPIYGLSVTIPSSWSIQELNKRPATQTNTECADYIIKDTDNTVTLFLIASCGLPQQVSNLWPLDTNVIKNFGDGKFTIRYFDPGKRVYRYATGTETSTGPNTPVQRLTSGVLSLQQTADSVTMTVEASFIGQKENEPATVQILDQIVTSIQ